MDNGQRPSLIDLRADRRDAVLFDEAGQQQLVMAGDFGLPARFDDDGLVVLDDDRRALHPVEAMRAEAADIGGNELHRRVPSPGTDDEIGNLATTMNEMLDRIEASSEAQARFVSDASQCCRRTRCFYRRNCTRDHHIICK